MDKFRIPKIPISVNKSVRFPVTMVDEVEEAIRGQDCTFSAFVVSAVRWALDNLERTGRREKQRRTAMKNVKYGKVRPLRQDL